MISDSTEQTPRRGLLAILVRRAPGWRVGPGAAGALLWALPALLAAAYLIVLVVNFREVITSINMYGDAIIAPVMAKLLGQAPAGSHVLLGHHAYYEEFLFLRATSGLSFYRQLWEVAPLLWTLLGVGMLAWAARRALGGLAAVLTASALICLGPLGRYSFFIFDWHGLTVIHTILIGCSLVWLAPRAERIGWGWLVAVAVALGLISALPTASDLLFLFWALVPMLIAALLMSSRSVGRSRWTPVVFVAITVLVALLAGTEIAHLMRSGGINASRFTYSFVGSAAVALHNLEVLFEGYIALGGGYFFGMKVTLLGLLVFVSGALIVVGLAFGLREVRRWATEAYVLPTGRQARPPTVAYVAFWTSSLLLQSLVFVITSVPKVTTGSSRYVLAGYVAIMALVPLIARHRGGRRLALAAGVSLFALSGVIQLARQPFTPFGPYPTPTIASRVLQFARANDVRYGYAGYWDAPDLTWLTRFQLKIYPIQRCGRKLLCVRSPARISSWYITHPGTRSMLIADSKLSGLEWLDGSFGTPVAVTHVGNLTVAVYPYDVASRFSMSFTA